MDGQRFDNFVRSFASAITRRHLIKTLAAGALSAVPGLGRTASAEGECTDDTSCTEGGICCSGFCVFGLCCDEDNNTQYSRCASGEQCYGNYCQPFNCDLAGYCDSGICCNGECIDIECCPFDNSTCEPGFQCMSMGYCVPDQCDDCGGALCCNGVCDTTFTFDCCPGTSVDCPYGMICGSQGSCELRICDSSFDCAEGAAPCCDGYCQYGWTCCPSGPYCPNEGEECRDNGNGQWVCLPPPCTSDSDCSSGICCQSGQCYDGECCVTDTNADARCPSGQVCFEGQCDDARTQCAVDADCSGGICCNEVCYSGQCCVADPNDKHCPEGTTCFEGVCDKKLTCVADSDCPSSSVCTNGACASKTPAKPTDKWKLWSDPEIRLNGANIYLRRLSDDDDAIVYGNGPIGPVYTNKDFARLAGYRANYVDISHPATYTEEAPYKAESASETSLANLVKQATDADLYVVISLRTGPGRSEATSQGFPVCRAGGCFSADAKGSDVVLLSSKLWDDEKALDAWVASWAEIARTYANNPAVIGYNLMAMPDAPTTERYLALLARIVTAIRTEDRGTPILISAPGKGLADDLKKLKPLDDERIVYRFDTFAPARYLRQEADSAGALEFGGDFDPDEDGEEGTFDRAWLRSFLKPALTWSADNKRPIAVGGYGMPRWQPELAGYLDDLVELFAKYEWSTGLWMWHPEAGPDEDDAFNLEHGDDPDQHDAIDNGLLDLITQYWKKNNVRLSTGT